MKNNKRHSYYNVALYFKRPCNKHYYYKVTDNYFYNISKARIFIKKILNSYIYNLKAIDVFLHKRKEIPCLLVHKSLNYHRKIKGFGKL